MASLDAILVPIQNDFVLSVDHVATLVLTFATGSMLALFVAGALVDRIGPRRVLTAGAVICVVGAATVALAGGFGWLVAGRVVGGIGGTSMSVASLAVLNATFTDHRERAHVFGLFAAVIGATYVVSPVIGGLIAENLSWRLVPVLWMAVAVGSVLILRASEMPQGSDGRRELLTPLAAGAALSALCAAVLALKESPAYAVLGLAVATIALVVLVVRWASLRRQRIQPTLDVSIFAAPGARPLMVAMIAVGAVNLLFYGSLYMQYRLGFSPTETAGIFAVPQAAGIAGGLVGGWASARAGSLPITAVALALGASAAALFLSVDEGSGAWHLLVLLSVYAFAAGSTLGTLTKAFMDCAKGPASGAAASWRQAGWSLGSTLGGVATGAIVLSYFSAGWQSILRAEGVGEDAARWAAESVRGGVPVAQVVHNPVVSELPGGEAIQNLVGLTTAQAATLRLVAVLAAGAYVLALVFVLVAMRRQRKLDV